MHCAIIFLWSVSADPLLSAFVLQHTLSTFGKLKLQRQSWTFVCVCVKHQVSMKYTQVTSMACRPRVEKVFAISTFIYYWLYSIFMIAYIIVTYTKYIRPWSRRKLTTLSFTKNNRTTCWISIKIKGEGRWRKKAIGMS